VVSKGRMMQAGKVTLRGLVAGCGEVSLSICQPARQSAKTPRRRVARD
jgi:hypothetical protein